MVVNFRACEISRGTRKLAWTPMLIKKNNFIVQITLGQYLQKQIILMWQFSN